MVRKLHPREVRQRKAAIKFVSIIIIITYYLPTQSYPLTLFQAKTFMPLSLLLCLVKNLPYALLTFGQYLDDYMGMSDYTWSVSPSDICKGFQNGSKGDGRIVVVTGANSGIGESRAVGVPVELPNGETFMSR